MEVTGEVVPQRPPSGLSTVCLRVTKEPEGSLEICCLAKQPPSTEGETEAQGRSSVTPTTHVGCLARTRIPVRGTR